MGYRSEVVLYVGPEVMPQFMVTMAKSPQARELCFAAADQMIKDYGDEEGSFLFKWNWLKWYESYECVQALTDFMDWCDGEDIPVGMKDEEGKEKTAHGETFYKFIRIGEEMDDNELRGDAMWGDICINRSIEF
jgi:hypothetical protein